MQDPKRVVIGTSGPVDIPLAAVPSARLSAQAEKNPKMAAVWGQEDDAAASDSPDEDIEDVEFLFSDDEQQHGASGGKKRQRADSLSSSVDTLRARQVYVICTQHHLTPPPVSVRSRFLALQIHCSFYLLTFRTQDDKAPTDAKLPVTDFVAGALDLASLPRLQPPSWATGLALKNISVEVKKLQEIQEKGPLHELGWYVDFDKLDNLFQWIVELHSFDLTLPLAQDMKSKGVSSVVCELRFSANHPFSPPFVRCSPPPASCPSCTAAAATSPAEAPCAWSC